MTARYGRSSSRAVTGKVEAQELLNYHTALSALWTWAVKEGHAPRHIVHDVDRPKPEKRAIVPFTEEDVRAMLDALGRSRTTSRPGKRKS